ncbi:MAG: hypothetical protein K6G86_01265 [Bacteroidales bacterium]|nr:hypothetical protein [Bacteroidales bacterium]
MIRLLLTLSSLILSMTPAVTESTRQANSHDFSDKFAEKPISASPSVVTGTTAPFGWATAFSLTEGSGYALTGGDPARTIVLQSNGFDMREDVIKAVKDYDVIVFDGARGDFIISSTMQFRGLRGKTLLGVNGARIRTQFEVTPELRKLLDDTGVKAMSDQGGGGELSNGVRVAEERELHTRQAIIDHTGDTKEVYRNAGLFSLNGCENIIIRNLALVGPGPIDVGGADLLTLSNGSRHIWVDHVSFTDGMDGNFDINSRSDFITVSWCVFQYTDRAYDHKASNLIGSSERPDQGVDNLNVTFAYCIWGAGCEVRMPVVRFGKVHVLNTLYDCAGNGSPAINARIDSEVLIEGNYFEKGVKKVFEGADNALAWQFKGNIFRERFSPADRGTVSMPYAYTAVPASQVPALVRRGAGPTLDLPVPASSVDFTIHLMGDSTMADKDISGLNPERGWGMVFENFLDSRVRVINYAKNGRSCKTAIAEGIWDRVKANIRPGDYLFIEFGHNDQKPKGKGYAPAWTEWQDYLRLFIDTARELGATPVLLTPVARRHFYGGVLDETTHGEYPASMRAVAAERGVTLIDMEQATIQWLKQAGDLASRPYFMWLEPGTVPAKPQGIQDNTHSTPLGARRNCDIVCDSIRVKLPEIAKHLVHWDAVVDQQGRGDYLTVQAAIDAAPDALHDGQYTILIKPGVYRERVVIPWNKRHLLLKGLDAANTVIVYGNYASLPWGNAPGTVGTSGSATLFVHAEDVTLEDLTVENDAGRVGQAVALFTNGDGFTARRCRFLGNQDTLYTFGKYSEDGNHIRNSFFDCYIEGTTDFIFGSSTAWFERCEIRSKADSYVTAASTLQGQPFGYVFKDCRLTADPGVTKVYLGRPWRPYAQTVFLNCELGGHIRPEGWHNWGKESNEQTAFYAEYGCTGPGSDASARVGWSHQLTPAEAARYTYEGVTAPVR